MEMNTKKQTGAANLKITQFPHSLWHHQGAYLNLY